MRPQATTDDIRYAYRLLLGRESDESGFEHYRRMLSNSPIDTFQLAEHFLHSDEFKASHGGRVEPREIAFDGYVMYVSPIDQDVGNTVAKGQYEPHVAQVVRENLRAGDTFVDVGANIGFFTSMAAHLVGPGGRVFAVEPMDKNVQLICRTIVRNGFDHVVVHPYAASDRCRIVPLASGDRTSNAEIPSDASRHRATSFAQARPLDDLLRGIDHIDLLKFDIEGHEMFAWEGFREGIARTRPLILTEFHPKCLRENAGIEPEAYLALLFEYASSLEVLTGAKSCVCRTVSDVIDAWADADRRLASGGTTHIDLFVKPRN